MVILPHSLEVRSGKVTSSYDQCTISRRPSGLQMKNKKIKLFYYMIKDKKRNARYIKNLSIKKNKGNCLYDIKIGKDFQNIIPKKVLCMK